MYICIYTQQYKGIQQCVSVNITIHKYTTIYTCIYSNMYVYTKEKIGFNFNPRFQMERAPNKLERLRLYPMNTD